MVLPQAARFRYCPAAGRSVSPVSPGRAFGFAIVLPQVAETFDEICSADGRGLEGAQEKKNMEAPRLPEEARKPKPKMLRMSGSEMVMKPSSF